MSQFNKAKPHIRLSLMHFFKTHTALFPRETREKKKGIQTFSEASFFFFLAQRETVWAELAATPACLKARRVSASALKQLD